MKRPYRSLCLAGAAALVLTRPFVVLAEGAQPSPSPSASPSPSPPPAESALPDLGGTDAELNYQETAGVQITRTWQAKSAEAMAPEPGPDGSVRFRYGQCMPQVVCGLFQQTDFEFEPGETFRPEDIHIGDTTRWVVESSVSGTDSDAPIRHVYVLPRVPGIYTTLDVTTSRRAYRVFLVSDSKRFFHHVSFLYPDKPKTAESAPEPSPVPDAKPEKAPAAVQVAYVEGTTSRKAKRVRVRAQLEGKGEAIERSPRNVGYKIVGNAPCRPVQAYSENGHTYIEMPSGIRDHDAPVLYSLRKSGWFHTNKDRVNFRVHGHWYVADEVIDKGLLTVGVGTGAKSVKVIRTSGGNGL
jgi:type IV secretory pathway VirB9-like protein